MNELSSGSVGKSLAQQPTLVADIDSAVRPDNRIDSQLFTRISDAIRSPISQIATDNDQLVSLGRLDLKLETEIKWIKANTTGFFAFFRYLFRSKQKAELVHLAQRMNELRDFIQSIRDAKPTKTTIHVTESNLEADPRAVAGKVTLKAVARPASPAAAPVDAASEQPSIVDVLVGGSQAASEETQAPLSLDAFSESALVQEGSSSARVGGAPPPPPPPGSKQPPKKLQGEPDEPKIILPGAKGAIKVEKLSTDQLKAESTEIKKYVAALKAAIDPVDRAIKEADRLESLIKGKQEELAELNKKISEKEKMLPTLNETTPSSKLKLKVKEGVELPIVYFSDQKFAELNKELIARGSAPLEDKFLRSKELKLTTQTITNLTKQRQATEALIQAWTKKLTPIKAAKNNGIPFAQFADVLRKKKSKLEDWERALRAREVRIAAPSKPKPVKAASEKKEASKKPNFTAAMKKDPKILEQFPELNEMSALLADQNAQILIKGDKFHDNLRT